MANPSQRQPPLQQAAPVWSDAASSLSTSRAKSGTTCRGVNFVTVSPATTNQNLEFSDDFKRVFPPISLVGAFRNHPAYESVLREDTSSADPNPTDDYDGWDGLSNRRKKGSGKIVALSEDFATAAEVGGKSADTAAAAGAEVRLAGVSTGLVSAIMTAYNRHCDLVLSPDDVWLTILAQFCAYVNNNAEGLRGKIVEHEGQEELKVHSLGTLETADYQCMIRDLLGKIKNKIKSPELADWFRPGFSTTTEKEEVCAAATAMATMQAYFAYTISMRCGIPSVTMLGTVGDWKLLREKIDRLLEFEVEGNPEGNVMELWVGYLRKVCDGFVESVEHPNSAITLEFWDKVLSHRPGYSGPSYITGWLSAFTCFNNDGKFVGEVKGEGSEFPLIDDSTICHNVVSCRVKIDDNGVEHDGTLLVGQVVIEAEQGEGEVYPTIRPRNDWCMAVAVKK